MEKASNVIALSNREKKNRRAHDREESSKGFDPGHPKWKCTAEQAQAAMQQTWWNLGQYVLWVGLRDGAAVAYATDNSGPRGPLRNAHIYSAVTSSDWGYTNEAREQWQVDAVRELESGAVKAIGIERGATAPTEIPTLEWPTLAIAWSLEGLPALDRKDERGLPHYTAYKSARVLRSDALKVFPPHNEGHEAEPLPASSAVKPPRTHYSPEQARLKKAINAIYTQRIPPRDSVTDGEIFRAVEQHLISQSKVGGYAYRPVSRKTLRATLDKLRSPS